MFQLDRSISTLLQLLSMISSKMVNCLDNIDRMGYIVHMPSKHEHNLSYERVCSLVARFCVLFLVSRSFRFMTVQENNYDASNLMPARI